MSSEQRIAASRANGAKSHGPITAEGKRRASMNALRHGLLAKTVVLKCENPRNFEELFYQHIEHFQPLNDIELNFIEEMAVSYWRLRRLWAIETRQLDNAFDAHAGGDDMDSLAAAFSDLAAKPDLALIHRYETRLHRMYQRALNNLLRLREKKNLVPDLQLEPVPAENETLPNEPKPSVQTPTPAPDLPVRQIPAENVNLPNEPKFGLPVAQTSTPALDLQARPVCPPANAPSHNRTPTPLPDARNPNKSTISRMAPVMRTPFL